MDDSRKTAIINVLVQAGEAFCRTVGPQCEVVIHDLADMEHSIVWIMGAVTGRKVGGCMTAKGLSLVRSGSSANSHSYTTRTRDGKMVRSSLIFIKDRRGRPFAGMEVNFDASPFVAFRQTLEKIADPDEAYDFQDAFIDDAPQMLNKMLERAIGLIGKPVTQMNKADRLRFVKILDEAGVFELRKATPAVANYLGVTRFSIHNYLNEIRNRPAPDASQAGGKEPASSP
jgi:predicted transcriptional regulator YheO